MEEVLRLEGVLMGSMGELVKWAKQFRSMRESLRVDPADAKIYCGQIVAYHPTTSRVIATATTTECLIRELRQNDFHLSDVFIRPYPCIDQY